MRKIGRPDPPNAPTPTQVMHQAASGRSQCSPKAPDASRLASLTSNALTDPASGSIAPELLNSIQALTGAGDALHKAAFRLFLRHRLAKTLGEDATANAALDTLVDDVFKLMAADQELHNALLEAGKALVRLSR